MWISDDEGMLLINGSSDNSARLTAQQVEKLEAIV